MPTSFDFQPDVAVDTSTEGPTFDFQPDDQKFDFQPDTTSAPPSDIPKTEGALAKLNRLAKTPSPEWMQGGEQAIRDQVMGMIPKTPMQAAEQVFPMLGAARQGAQIATGDVSSIPLVGRVPEIIQAEKTPAFSKERYATGLRTLMDVGMLAGAVESPRVPLRGEPLPFEPPPTVSRGPGTTAGDVSAAMQEQAVPEANQQLATDQGAPAPSMEQATEPAPKIREPLSLDELRLMRERNDLQLQNDIAQRATGATHPAVDERLGQIDDELTNIANRELQPQGEQPDAIEPSNAQMEGGGIALGVETRPGSDIPETGSSNNVVGEAQRAEARGNVPGEQPVATGETVAPATSQTPNAPQSITAELPVTDSEPHVSAIANRFTQERAARGQIGEVAPGQGLSTADLVQRGLKMSPERVNSAVSRMMQGGDVAVDDAAAIRGEEARLSQRSQQLSKAADANPTNIEAKISADNAFKDLTDFHNGPVAQLKNNWANQGRSMQGEIPVDLSTTNGLREKWLKDTGETAPESMDKTFRKTADSVAKAKVEENGAMQKLGQEIEKSTKGRKLPSTDDVRNNIRERLGLEPCKV